MCAAVLPGKWDAVREVCERWGLPVAVIGRVTADGDITIVTGGLEPDGRRAPGARELARIPARALTSDAIVHQRVAAAADPSAAAPRRRARRRRSATGSRSAAWIPARSCWRCSGRPTSRRATPSSTSTTRRSARTRSPARVAAPPSCASRARARPSSPRPTATRRSARSIRGSARRSSVAEATRNVSITGARPLGVTNCLNYGDPTRPEAFWQLQRGRPRPRRRVPGARAAGHRRQRLALQRVAGRGDRADRRDRRRRAARRHRHRSSARPSTQALDDRPARRRGRPGPGRLGLRRARRRATRGRPAGARPRSARPPSRRSSARRSRAASSPRRRTCRAAASPSPSPSARCGAGSARRSGSRSATRRRSTCSARARRGWS